VHEDRESLLAQLDEHGQRRRAAHAAQQESMDAIASLLPRALNAGIPKREIARRTGLSRVWIDELLRRADRDDPS
jgi:hypothetical protein